MQEQVYKCTLCGHLNIKYIPDHMKVPIGGEIKHWCNSLQCKDNRIESILKRVY